jgi:alanyl aminopeptidase
VPKLARDPRREVVQHAIRLAAGLRSHLVPDALLPNYGRFVRKTFLERARQLGWVPRAGEDDDTRLLRSSLLSLVADEGADPPLRRQALELAKKWLTDKKAVDGEVIGAVLSTASRIGDQAFFDELYSAAKTEKERRDRKRMLSTLGGFTDPKLAKEALDVTLAKEFDPRESQSIVWRQTGWPTTRTLAWDFVKTHFGELDKRLPLESVASLPGVPVSFCDQEHRNEMATFFKDKSPKLPGGPRKLAQALEKMELCRAYVDAQQASAIKFLETY